MSDPESVVDIPSPAVTPPAPAVAVVPRPLVPAAPAVVSIVPAPPTARVGWGRWAPIVELVISLAKRNKAYRIHRVLTQTERESLRAAANWQRIALHIRNFPPRDATSTVVWVKGERKGFDKEKVKRKAREAAKRKRR